MAIDPLSIKNSQAGSIGIAIGNGPSLNAIPTDFLLKYRTFGVNYINRLPFQPTYYVCIDSDVLANNASSILNVASSAEISFLSQFHANDQNIETQSLYALPNIVLIGYNDVFTLPGEKVMSGWTGVYVALKVAYYMGFSTILLVGVAHTSDWEHFTDDQPVGDQMTDYRFEGQREHFQLTNDTFGGDNKKILYLSPPSPLDTIIERGNINDWM